MIFSEAIIDTNFNIAHPYYGPMEMYGKTF